MSADRTHFVRGVIALYLGLPHVAARRFSAIDRSLANQLFDRDITLDIVRAAMLLAIARRSARLPASPPLPPIRSLHYFVPIIDELITSPPDPDYLRFLDDRYRHLLVTT